MLHRLGRPGGTGVRGGAACMCCCSGRLHALACCSACAPVRCADIHTRCCCALPLPQYKFGARSGRAPVLLGCAKIALALLFGSSLLPLAQHFPQPLLGSLLLFSGLELAGAAAAEDGGRRGWALLLLTAAGIIGLGGDAAAGFGVGCAAAGALAAGDGVVGHWRRWRAEDEEVASSSKPSHPGDVEGLC